MTYTFMIFQSFAVINYQLSLQSNWGDREHQKYFWNVIMLQEKSQLGMRNKART